MRRPAKQCNPQTAQGLSVLQSASIRSPPCTECKIASGVRTCNCAGPGTASELAPGALKG
eukprot:11459194-Alexandrium_andersonii.AAC.1